MRDEPAGVPPDQVDSEAPAPGPTFSQEGYDRLMRAQGPWLKSRLRVFSGWDEFAKHQQQLATRIETAIAEWNRLEGPLPPLDGANLKGAYLKGVNLSRATLAGADLSYANLEGASFERTCLEGATLDRARLTGARLKGVRLAGASLRETDLEGADLTQSDLEGAHLSSANLERAELSGARMGWTHLDRANLANVGATGATFPGARISDTKLIGIQFGPEHDSMHDGSDRIVLTGRDSRLSWGMLRRVGSLPLFEVSYIALAVSLITIGSVAFLNRTELIDWLRYPIPIPPRIPSLFLSSVFLVLGTTMYKLACPQRVQTFSETEWVEQHGKPRLQYLSESSKRPWQIPTLVATSIGGALGIALLVERVWSAFVYLLQNL